MFSKYIRDQIDLYKMMDLDLAMELLSFAQNGDVEARNDLIMGHIRLIPSIIKTLKIPPGLTADDLFQESIIGMTKCIESGSLKEPRNIRFNLWRSIKWHLSIYLDKFRSNWRTDSLDEPIYTDLFSDPIERVQLIEDPINYLEIWEREEDVRRYLRCLDPLNQKILILRYGLFSFKRLLGKEVGSIFNMTEQKVSSIKRESEEYLKALQDEDLNDPPYELVNMDDLRQELESMS